MGTGMVMQVIMQFVELCVIGFALAVQGSTEYNISPSPATSSVIPPIVGAPGPVHHRKSLRSNAPSPASLPNVLRPSLAWPPLLFGPVPQKIKGHMPYLSHSTPTVSPPYPPSLDVQGHVPSLSPSTPQRKAPAKKTPVAVPLAPVSVATPSRNAPVNKAPIPEPIAPDPFTTTSWASPVPEAPIQEPGTLPPSAHEINAPYKKAPIPEPIAPVSVASPPRQLGQNSPAVHPIMSRIKPPILTVPVAPPTSELSRISPAIHPIIPEESPSVMPDTDSSPASTHPPSLFETPKPSPPVNHSPTKAPSTPKAMRHSDVALAPSPKFPVNKGYHCPASSPSASFHKDHQARNKVTSPAPSSYLVSPPTLKQQGPAISPVFLPKSRQIRYAPPPLNPGSLVSPSHFPFPPSGLRVSSAPSPSPTDVSGQTIISPSGSSSKSSKMPLPPSIQASLPPPPNDDEAADPDFSPASTPPPSINWKRDGVPFAAPPFETPKPLPPVNHSLTKAPSMHNAMRHSDNALAPSLSYAKSPLNKGYYSPASPSTSFHNHRHARNKVTSSAPASSYLVSPTTLKQQGAAISPVFLPKSRQVRYAPPPLNPGSSVSPSHFPYPPSVLRVSPAPSPSPTVVSGHIIISPSESSSKSSTVPPPPPIRALPPPPPNEDCSTTICKEPYTNTPPGSRCDCVWPMQVGLRLSVALYTFFPLVSELAGEIATGVFMKQSQVRIIGANAASQEPEKTVVLIDLVPLGEKFNNTMAFFTSQRFWHKQVAIKASFFGDYEVLYVSYPGLPPSPPSAPSNITMIGDGDDSNARTIKPLGADVRKRRHKDGLTASVIAIIALSAFVAIVLFFAAAWVLLFRHRDHVHQPEPTSQASLPSLAKRTGIAGSMVGSGPSSASLSFGSSIATLTGSAKTFSASDMERVTDNFDASRILGEGGFGRVYSGVLEDGTKVAVKVLKRDDQQGGREFLAEVEMLSRLHHRNLVKLIGICTDERTRCLVYELIPNGSVESHLHGVDKETAPLDWGARMKIALGAARGLAYLHEDSNPRVIHRDFKSSNILLEYDFTPKVSDFGLARTAMDEENRHISTRVMGTFGYVAPEYAMTGHLLVKSDVYSYGVVLLELLTRRKPIDMSQPPGQENLVAWARPLLSNKEGLETIIDPSLGSNVPFDNVAKVAAIASMCVQSEVSHRPFMSEVVQALKLICNDRDEARVGSRSSSHEDLSIDLDTRVGMSSEQLPDPLQSQYLVPNYDSGLDTKEGLPMSEEFSTSARYGRQASGSFRRHSSSGPLRTGRGRLFWQSIRRLPGDSVSEHGVAFRLWSGSH